VELVAPVDEPALRDDLLDTLERCLADDTNAWELEADGEWTRIATSRKPHTHQSTMMRRAQARVRRHAREQRAL
jgi:polyphosphate kinase